jgi:hypothetical protein
MRCVESSLGRLECASRPAVAPRLRDPPAEGEAASAEAHVGAGPAARLLDKTTLPPQRPNWVARWLLVARG